MYHPKPQTAHQFLSHFAASNGQYPMIQTLRNPWPEISGLLDPIIFPHHFVWFLKDLKDDIKLKDAAVKPYILVGLVTKFVAINASVSASTQLGAMA